MGLFQMKPSRAVAGEDIKVVADLDAMVARPIAFILHGKKQIIKPITTEQFLILCNALGAIQSLKGRIDKGEKVSNEEVIEKYHNTFKSCSDTLTLDDLEKMSYPQMGALLSLILKQVGAETHLVEPDSKKKV